MGLFWAKKRHFPHMHSRKRDVSGKMLKEQVLTLRKEHLDK
jgi:hypothetical protein